MKIFGLHILTDKKFKALTETVTIEIDQKELLGKVVDQWHARYVEARNHAIEVQKSYQDLLKENTQINIAMGKVSDIKDLLDSFERIKGILRKQ